MLLLLFLTDESNLAFLVVLLVVDEFKGGELWLLLLAEVFTKNDLDATVMEFVDELLFVAFVLFVELLVDVPFVPVNKEAVDAKKKNKKCLTNIY